MKTVVSRFLAVFALAIPAAWAETNFDGGNWVNGPIDVVVDVSGANTAGSADSAALFEAVRAAAAKWNAVLKLPLLRVAAASLPDRADGNGRNELVFSPDVSPDVTFSDQFGAVAIHRGDSGRLLECDLVFNPKHRWLVYSGALQYEDNGDRVPDFYRVALHEMGHLLGFDHPKSDEQVTIMRTKMSDVDDLTTQDLRDAKIAASTLAFVNRPRLSAPRTLRTTTSSRRLSLRGTANPFFTRTVVVRVNSDRGSRRYVLRPGKSWRKTIALQPGRNVLRLFYREPHGALARFALHFATVRRR